MDIFSNAIPSLIWSLWVTAVTIVGTVVFLALIANFTKWGQKFWRISKNFINIKHNTKNILIFILIIYLTILSVRINVLVTYWYNNFWGYVQNYQTKLIWEYVWLFGVLCIILAFDSFITMYLTQGFVILWRKHLNAQILNDYLGNKKYYKSDYVTSVFDNPDQRIQQDITDFATVSTNLLLSFLSNTISLITYTVVLWDLSSGLHVFGVYVPHAEVFAIFIFTIVTAVWAFRIGKPFVKLTFLQQEYNADYRHALIKVNDNRESIAFQNGEKNEYQNLDSKFDLIIQNAWRIVHRNILFQGYNFVINQLSIQLPTLLLMPAYFAKLPGVSIGTIQSVGSAFGQLYSSLYWFQSVYGNSAQLSTAGNAQSAGYGSFASYMAILNRLSGFYDVIDEAKDIPTPNITLADSFNVENLDVYAPEGRLLLRDLNLKLNKGQHLIIQGPSGSGKTTLLRSFAGLWPFTAGNIEIQDNSVFLPQRPYIPNGSLAEALYYPKEVPQDRDIKKEVRILQDVSLDILIPLLENEDNNTWLSKLSLGERQRLAFARLFLDEPELIFLDEATASLDEGLENALYTLLQKKLPNSTMITVAHRSTVLNYHALRLQINDDHTWELNNVVGN